MNEKEPGPMTVEQLIAKLQTLNPEKPVAVRIDTEDGWSFDEWSAQQVLDEPDQVVISD